MDPNDFILDAVDEKLVDRYRYKIVLIALTVLCSLNVVLFERYIPSRNQWLITTLAICLIFPILCAILSLVIGIFAYKPARFGSRYLKSFLTVTLVAEGFLFLMLCIATIGTLSSQE